MRSVRFPSAIAASLALLATSAAAQSVNADIGVTDILVGSTTAGDMPRPVNCDGAANGDLYVANFHSDTGTTDGIRRIPAGSTTPELVIELETPMGIVLDAQARYMYIARWDGDVRSLDLQDVASGTTVISSGHTRPSGIDLMASSGLLYVTDRSDNTMHSIQTDGSSKIQRRNDLHTARSVAIQQSSDLLYVVSLLGQVVYEVAADGSSATIVAGQLTTPAHVDGTGTNARFMQPVGCSISRDGGFLFVADRTDTNSRLRRVDLSNYDVTTVMNTLGSHGSLTAATQSFNARLSTLQGSCFSNDGSELYVLSDHAIQRVVYNGTPEPTTTTTGTTPPPSTTGTTPPSTTGTTPPETTGGSSPPETTESPGPACCQREVVDMPSGSFDVFTAGRRKVFLSNMGGDYPGRSDHIAQVADVICGDPSLAAECGL